MVKYSALYKEVNKRTQVPEDQWLFLETLFQESTYSKGDHLLRSGENTEYLYFIRSGLTRSYYQDSGGKEYNKLFLSDGEVASAYMEMHRNIPARLSIQALEDTNTLLLKFDDLQKLFKRHECWNTIGRLMAQDYFIKKDQREYEFLLLDATQRYKNFLSDYKELKERIPQYHVAAYLGISPVSLSRLIAKINK
jgi:CRP-like cAMP-binding protein